MVSLMDVSAGVAALSAALMLGLVVIYVRMYRDTHAQFSLGLTIFAMIVFVQNVVAVYSFFVMSPLIDNGPFAPYLLAINIAEVFGITVLFRTTLAPDRKTHLSKRP